jgi:hypothetical protein
MASTSGVRCFPVPTCGGLSYVYSKYGTVGPCVDLASGLFPVFFKGKKNPFIQSLVLVKDGGMLCYFMRSAKNNGIYNY